MFAIVISEKGGGERRELFDKHEIHVGRVQGNDITLPKGNVSKRHARLMFRDGRVIVTDLKSTNGTYVNGRKIAQATVVREGDKIYVGDFVLRVELGEPSSNAPLEAQSSDRSATTPPGQMPAASATFRPPFGSDAEFTARQDAVLLPPSRGATRTALSESPARPTTGPAEIAPETSGATIRPLPPSAPGAAAERSEQPPPAREALLHRLLQGAGSEDELDPTSVDPDSASALRIEHSIRERALGLLRDQSAPGAPELDELVSDALHELLGLGPIDGLLGDPDVIEVRAFGPHQVTARKSDGAVVTGLSFSSEEALLRAVLRLCQRSGTPREAGETVIERRLPNGLVFQAILAPMSEHGPALVVKRPRRTEAKLDDLVRSGTISRTMATLLSGCVSLRTNVLVTGPADGTAPLLAALLAAAAPRERAVVLQGADELCQVELAPVLLRLPDTGAEGAKLVRAAARLNPERMAVSPLLGQVAAAVLAAIGQGSKGVLAAIPAPSLRHALPRLVADLMIALPGLSLSAAQNAVLGTFEMAAEVTRLRDGRYRVTRLAELAAVDGDFAPNDVFTFVVERTAAGGAVEGSFLPTGFIPKIAGDLAAEGAAFDSAVFRRERS